MIDPDALERFGRHVGESRKLEPPLPNTHRELVDYEMNRIYRFLNGAQGRAEMGFMGAMSGEGSFTIPGTDILAYVDSLVPADANELTPEDFEERK